ncbi:MAG TPA: thioredoxin domain-containing protein [Candidatus Kapabacteria bacterium]|nr:thioredoxin domain-containing protein [Candidatus Kapabacteria bacterium]
MIQSRHLYFIFIPAFLVGALGLFIAYLQYEPLYPDVTKSPTTNTTLQIPILPTDPVLGNKKAPTTLIVFADFGCEACKEEDALLEQLIKKHEKQVKIIWKGLPVTKFPFNTRLAHEYSVCANEQGKFLPFKQVAYANKDNLSQQVLQTIATTLELNEKKLATCLTDSAPTHVNNTEQIALSLNVQSVPAVFLDNRQITPPQTVEAWEALLGL